jgi:hypothetical protein
MNLIANDSKQKSGASTLSYLATGAVLLIVPVALISVWGSQNCTTSPAASYCIPSKDFKVAIDFLPFLMLIGGILIGYKMKKISDSLLPPPDEEEAQNRDRV